MLAATPIGAHVRVSGGLAKGGLAYANDLRGWLAHMPVDPERSLVASFHVYNFNECITPSCWDAQVKPLAARVPIVTGEIGEDDCAHGFIDLCAKRLRRQR